MKIQEKLAYLFVLGFAAYLVQQTGSDRRMINGGTSGDMARQYLYCMSCGAAIGLVLRKNKKDEH